MGGGIGEDPKRSPGWHLAQLEYPATREDLVQTAEDNEAPAEVINFFKALPKQRYASAEEVLRDFAEAERRVAGGDVAGGRGRGGEIGENAAAGAGEDPSVRFQ